MLGIIMTGMGDDGLVGCQRVAAKGGAVWAQDERSSTVYGMPRQIVQAGLANEIRSLKEIGEGIAEFGSQRRLSKV